MISSSANFGVAIKEDSRDFTARLSVNGVTLDVGIMSMSITKGSCGSDQFGIGEVISSRLNLVVKELSSLVKGDDIKVEIGLMVNGAYEYINLGYFTATEVKKTPYRATITAYGHAVSKTNMAITGMSTQTLASVKNAISSACGYNVTLPNSVTTTRTIDKDMNGLTAYQCLQVLASVIGGYVVDVNDGSIAIKLFDDTSVLSVDPDQMVALPDFEETDFTINGFEVTAGDTVYTYGTADVIIDNPYMTQDLFDNEFTPNLYGYAYRPATVDMSLGDPRLEGDDVLTVYDFLGNAYIVPCHQITHTYDGGLMTHIESIRATQVANSEATPAPISSQIKEQEKEIIEVGKIASNTNQYFWFNGTGTDTGAHITEVPQDEFTDSTNPNYHSGGNLLARSNGIAVRDGMTELATFGATGATIGETTKTHLELDYHSIQGIDKNGYTYFYVSDLRDANGNYTATQKFTGDGVTTQFYTELSPITSPTVTINGVATTAYTIGSGIYNNQITFTTAPSDGAEIIITFTTTDADAKAFSLGQRRAGSTVGASSVAMGTTNEASGFASVSEGGNNKAKGDYSHAEGHLCEANGSHSHAGGEYSVADGEDSFAQGDHAKTQYKGQTAIGEYNNCQPNLAFMVGDGSSDNARKNLLGLESNAFGGNLRIKGDVYVGCNDDSTGGTKLGTGGGGVTGVKGNDESTYRTGNVNIAPSDLGEADFVVEQGVASGWTYRKWNSGIAEMWCTETTTARTNTSDGGGYVSESAVTPSNFPFSFTDIPNVQCTINSSSITGSPTSTVQATVNSAGSWKLYRNSSNTSTSTKRFNFYVIGKYQ